MSRRRPSRPLAPEERELWRRFARGVQPLDASRQKRLDELDAKSDTPAKPKPQSAPLKTGAAQRNSVPASLKSPKPADRSSEKRVRRGQVEIEARLDLHGMTTSAARGALLSFLGRSRRNGFRTVLVITGKGAGARAVDQRKFQPWTPEERPLPGVLRRSFADWMRDPDFAFLVSGYSQASRKHGGSGAFYVMLRRS